MSDPVAIKSVSSPQGRMAAAAQLLDGTELVATSAHGKHLFLDFEADRVVHIHLGLIGKFQLGPLRPPVGQVRLRLADDRVAAAVGGRRLPGMMTVVSVAFVLLIAHGSQEVEPRIHFGQ